MFGEYAFDFRVRAYAHATHLRLMTNLGSCQVFNLFATDCILEKFVILLKAIIEDSGIK